MTINRHGGARGKKGLRATYFPSLRAKDSSADDVRQIVREYPSLQSESWGGTRRGGGDGQGRPKDPGTGGGMSLATISIPNGGTADLVLGAITLVGAAFLWFHAQRGTSYGGGSIGIGHDGTAPKTFAPFLGNRPAGVTLEPIVDGGNLVLRFTADGSGSDTTVRLSYFTQEAI